MQTIVLIEDNPQNARLAAKLLRLAGYCVLLAEDGESGMALLQDTLPDLILIDLGLPDIDGQTIVAMLRQEEALAHVPVVAFTAWPADTAADMARAYGCSGVVTKPIDTRRFAAQIAVYLEQSLPTA